MFCCYCRYYSDCTTDTLLYLVVSECWWLLYTQSHSLSFFLSVSTFISFFNISPALFFATSHTYLIAFKRFCFKFHYFFDFFIRRSRFFSSLNENLCAYPLINGMRHYCNILFIQHKKSKFRRKNSIHIKPRAFSVCCCSFVRSFHLNIAVNDIGWGKNPF